MSKEPRKRKGATYGKYEKEDATPLLGGFGGETTFSLRLVCMDQHAISNCTHQQLLSMTDKIRMLCSLTWSQIDSSPRTTNGYEPLPREILSRSIPNSVPAKRDIIAFRFGGGAGSKNSGRMVGFRDGQAFFLLFVDAKLDLYRHG